MNQDLQRALISKALEKVKIDVVAGTIIAGPMLTVELDAGRGKILQPSTILHSPAVGERVWVLRLGVFSLILGVAGGRDPNTITVNGAEYQRSGTLTATVSGLAAWESVYWALISAPLEAPPPGFRYVYALQYSTRPGSYWLGESNTGGNKFYVYSAAAAGGTVTVSWQLIKT